ncbi:MAG TPA: hypothetical protein VIK48_04310 [Candidatus Manganitrophaceae bacterium]
MKPSPHSHLKFKICVSGAAETDHCGPEALEMAKEVGREIARQGAVIVTGATTGVPFWAAIGAKEEGGFSIGISPAKSEREHVEEYHLPMDYMDVIIYTGFGYSGRNLLLTRSSDAVIFGCGRIGTLNEFTDAFEDDKPMGVIVGPWETDEIFKDVIAKSHRGPGKIVYDSNLKTLVQKVVAMIRKEKIIEI